jgi:uncharacterized protein (TIGR03435 family)
MWRGASYENACRCRNWQPVIDATGLDWFYEVKLEWAPADLSAWEPTDTPAGPSIYSALQSQLGLKLEARRDRQRAKSAGELPSRARQQAGS